MATKKPLVSGSSPGTIQQLQSGDSIAQADIENLVSNLAAKAPLASPALTGTPTAPTATAGTNTTQVATTAFVTTAVASGGGGVAWSTVNVNTSMADDNAYVVTGARDMTLPASAAAGKQFIVHAYDATVRIVSNGNVITGVGSGNNLTIAVGETAHLVARTTGNLEIV